MPKATYVLYGCVDVYNYLLSTGHRTTKERRRQHVNSQYHSWPSRYKTDGGTRARERDWGVQAHCRLSNTRPAL